MEKLKRIFGSGIGLGTTLSPFLALTTLLSVIYKDIFQINFISERTMFVFAVIFFIIGASIHGEATAKLMKAEKNGEACFNPIGIVILFIYIPGIALTVGSWLVFAVALFGYVKYRQKLQLKSFWNYL